MKTDKFLTKFVGFGGDGEIRTLEPFWGYTISNRAPSTGLGDISIKCQSLTDTFAIIHIVSLKIKCFLPYTLNKFFECGFTLVVALVNARLFKYLCKHNTDFSL